MEENNKIIAEFMGRVIPIDKLEFYDENPTTHYYHFDWNWLMQVVEKIENTKFNNSIFKIIIGFGTTSVICESINGKIYQKWDSSKQYSRIENGIQTQGFDVPNTKIEGVYSVVVEFIKWYNNQELK